MNCAGRQLTEIRGGEMRMQEYGGYLPLELRQGEEYYRGKDCVALNAGRYAIRYAVRDTRLREPVKKLWLPYYICPTVEQALQEEPVEIGHYHIGRDLLPAGVELEEGEYLLWVNYFGMQSGKTAEDVAARYPRLFIDNTQAFFAPPVKGAYNIYSCRKFFGVTDGAYVVREGIFHQALPADYSSGRAGHLLKSLEYGTNAAYGQNKSNERELDTAGMRAMSALTKAILSGTDYEYVRRKRLENAALLDRLLGGRNRLHVNTQEALMAYPFACEKEGLREYLVANHVYAAKLWKEVSADPRADAWEKELADTICILPVDQRYSGEDMRAAAGLVEEFLAEEPAGEVRS